MKIPIRHLQDGHHQFEDQLSVQSLELEDQPAFSGTVTVVLEASKHEATMNCAVQIQTIADLPCDRCLDPVRLPLDLQPQLVIRFGKDTLETEEEDVVHVQPDQLDFDLQPWIREHLMVALPMKVLCQEECAGFCPGCGKNLNEENCSCDEAPVDPRWEKLMTLKKK